MNDTPKDESAFGQCTAAHHRQEGERCHQPAIDDRGLCASHAPSDPEDTQHGRCTATAKSSGERCGNAAVGPHGKCRFHGGKTPSKKENPNVGAPTGNARNLKHGVYADALNLYRHLTGADREWVDSLVAGYVDLLDIDATDPRVERVLRACVHIYQSWSAEDRIFEDGLSEETVVGVTDEGHPIITKQGHHLHQFSVQRDRQAQKILRELGCFDRETTNTLASASDKMSSESYTIVVNPDDEDED